MARDCKTMVDVGTRNDGSPIMKRCGTTYDGDEVLCDEHYKQAIKRYPQGWVYYPGDTCKHGTYVGGCGFDHMCPACETGHD